MHVLADLTAWQVKADYRVISYSWHIGEFSQGASVHPPLWFSRRSPARQEADMLLHASHSSNDLPLLQNAAPAVPPPLPATPLWFQGTPDIDFQIMDDLASQGNFAF
ncbi:uncharacterized protein [Lolium perenne]|uniref:uncharacterized protein n=1 Tax=Lolium perenne TaxID=4522 RepID=UPI003A99A346